MMTSIYLITFCVLYVCSKTLYHNKINPITIYTFLWFSCVCLYNSGIVKFYPLKWETFGYIYGANIVFVIGCLLGLAASKIAFRFTIYNYERPIDDKKRCLKRIIFLTTALSAIGIVPDIITSISTYGLNLLANTSDMYFNEISSSQESALSFSAFIFVTAIYVSIYIVDYGFDKLIYFPLLMFALFAFSKGSRGTFVIIIFLLISEITLPGIHQTISKAAFKKNVKKILKFFLIFVAIIIAITSVRQRSEDIYYGYLAFDFLSGTALISVLGYICSGIGCLNQFFDFPVTSDHPVLFFRVFYVLFNKLELSDVDTIIHFPTYYTPIPGNVLTYIGELYIDFQEYLFIVIFILSSIFSYSFAKVNKKDSILHRTIYATLFAYFMLSFFASFLHAAGLWYAIVLGIFFSFFVDYKIKL